MAEQTATVESRMRVAYAIEGVPQTSVLVEKPFNIDEIPALEMYQFAKTNLTEEELHIYGKHMIDQIQGDLKNVSIGKVILLLALNLKDPTEGKENELILKKLCGTNVTLLESNKLGFTRSSASSSEQPPTTPSKESGEGGTETQNKLFDALNNTKKNDPKNKGQNSQALTCSPSFIPFLAAYLLKSQVKTPENLVLGEEKMRNSYIRFYKEATPLEIGLDKTTVGLLGERLKADLKIINTWIYATAHHEGTASSTEQGSGVIRFLANLPFSFNGMQAYGLFREALINFEPNPTELMIKLYMGETKPAIQEIHRILQNFETLTLADGTVKKVIPYFKYARLLNPEYFAKLQPTRCAGIIYILVKLLKSCVEYSNIADPEKIMALKKLGKARKEYYDAHVEALLEGASQEDPDATTVAKRAAAIRARNKDNTSAAEKAMRDVLKGRAQGDI
ncbi:TPA_asm: N [Betula betacytorhabdovirus 1]|nr:TPA_asm: N [Betula betacytorhabdovirus 1]